MEVKKFNRCGQSAGKTFNKRYISDNIGYYLSGFADGEGSFNVSLVKRTNDYRHGWKVSLSFNISQKDDTIPRIFKEILKCGTIRYRKDGICYFEVRRIKDLVEILIPFFQKFPLLSKNKRKAFDVFCQITQIVYRKKHLEKGGMKKILELRELIRVSRKRKYSRKEILKFY